MIDLTVEHALRQLAQEAGVSRAEMIEAIVRDWLIENKILKLSGAAPQQPVETTGLSEAKSG